MSDWIRSEAESTKFESVSYRALPPRRRDFWRVLLGRFTPTVVREVQLTLAGADRELKRIYTGPVAEAMNAHSPLFDLLTDIGMIKEEDHS